MATEIKMPQLGESVVEGTITKWLKQEGEEIGEDELLVEVSTDKVDSEVPSSAAGTLQKILVPEGETVKVGTPIALVGEGAAESGDAGSNGQAADTSGDAQSEEAEQPSSNGSEQPAAEAGDAAQAEAEESSPMAETGSGEAEKEGSPEKSEETPQPGEADEEPAAAADTGDPGGRPVAAGATESADGDSGDTSKRGIISPLVRRLADEHGVSLDDVQGTGTGGRIRKQDVLKYVETGKSKPAAKAAASEEPAPEEEPRPAAQPSPEPSAAQVAEREELVPWTNIRRRTAEHMVASARETARAWNAVEADWTNIVRLRTQAKEEFKKREGFDLTYMPFLARVICDTLLEMPEVNASFDEANKANRIKHYVNLGIAVALEGGGLIVPVIKGADGKNLAGLARDINDVAQRARSKKLSPDDLSGGSFTITNPGPFGSVISVPIIPMGQAAILGFEAIRKGVVVTDDDAIAIRSTGFLSLSWDHRVIDGAEAARFLSRLAERIETTDFSSELTQYL
ncbi:MAG: 2-oxo acid dehydrogenase subunit E2 [Actinomycetota bacterium]|nr:2-oxo acid dehydrogenase subunit E2 [Actinomycetota bacterium]